MRGLKRGDKMNGFLEVQNLLELEQAGRWNSAKEILYNLWYEDKNDIDKLCRVLAECWYVLSAWDCCTRNETLSFDAFKAILAEVMQYGLTHFSTNADFLWKSGYMISLFPYLFYEESSESLYNEWEQKGKSMLYSATQIDPDNLISKVLCLGTHAFSDEYLNSKMKLAPLLYAAFPGHTAIEVYFKDVLSN